MPLPGNVGNNNMKPAMLQASTAIKQTFPQGVQKQPIIGIKRSVPSPSNVDVTKDVHETTSKFTSQSKRFVAVVTVVQKLFVYRFLG